MAAKNGRLEAQHTFAANKTASFTSAAGTTVGTGVAGSHYLADMVSQANTDLTSRGITLTISDGEGTPSAATGLCTIAAPGQYNLDVTFTSTEIRDAFGFAGNIAGASSPQTGTRACPGLWLPSVAKFTRHGDGDAGTLNTSFRQTVGLTGTVFSFGGGTGYFRELNGIMWDGLPSQRMRPHLATYVNETLEEFLGNTQFATGTYAALFSTGSSVRIIWDADVDGTYKAGKFLFPPKFDPETMIRGWVSRQRFEFPQFIVGA